MEQSDCEMPGQSLAQPDSLFERLAWFYAMCREYLFRDHTQEIVRSLFPHERPAPGRGCWSWVADRDFMRAVYRKRSPR